MPRPGGSAEGGLTGEALGGSCFNAFRNAIAGQGGEFPEWDQTDESLQAGFMHAAGWLENFFSANEEEGGSWRALAAEAYLQFCKAASETPLALDAIPAETLTAWEAFTRHASNMLVFDPDDGGGDQAEHEAYWIEWAKDRKARTQMPQQLADAQRPNEE